MQNPTINVPNQQQQGDAQWDVGGVLNINAGGLLNFEAGAALASANGSIVLNQRIRATAAQVNAGLVLLPAQLGFRYRVIGIRLIAIGGAATTATSVDVVATQATASVKLLSAAIAALTQSTVVGDTSANVTILADGASFVPNDSNTAISISKTGAALAGATAIDVLFTFAADVG